MTILKVYLTLQNFVTGMVCNAASGYLRTMLVDEKGLLDMIPVDLAINALIVISKDLSTASKR